MYFRECERLAERYPDLAVVIEKVDAQLQKMGTPEVIRPHDFACFLGVDPNQICSIFEMLAQDGLFASEEMIECQYCQMPVLRSEYKAAMDEEGEYHCTDCDRLLTDEVVRSITTYRYGKKWKVAARSEEESGDTGPDESSRMLDDQAWYTHVRLAQVFGVNKGALRKRLERYRKSNLDGWKENEDRRPREPKYLYRLQDIRDIIEGQSEFQAKSG